MKKWIFFILLLSPSTYALPYHYSANVAAIIFSKEPAHFNGWQARLSYYPDKLTWPSLRLFFDGGFSYFRLTKNRPHRTIQIYAIAPVLRYYFKRESIFLPFVDASIGFAYLNRTRFDNRNLGMNFSFQDRIGLGALLGNRNQFSLTIYAIHYSNGSLSSHNSGITAPLMIDFGYHF